MQAENFLYFFRVGFETIFCYYDLEEFSFILPNKHLLWLNFMLIFRIVLKVSSMSLRIWSSYALDDQIIHIYFKIVPDLSPKL